MRHDALWLLVAGLAAGSVIAGCGNDDNDNGTTSTSAAISKQEFVTKANQICKQGKPKSNKLGSSFHRT
jgi:hypothetical protein